MKQIFRLILVSLLAGLWFLIEDALCDIRDRDGITRTFCYSSISGKTCFTKFLANNGQPIRMTFKEASRKCKSTVSGSTLIVIDSLVSLTIVDRFIGRDVLENEIILTDAQKLSPGNDEEWSWVNGHQNLSADAKSERKPIHDAACVKRDNENQLAYCFGNVSSQFRYICEYSDSKYHFSFRQNNRSYVASEKGASWFDARTECFRLRGDLASITNLKTIGNWSRLKANQKYWIGLYRNKWIWNSTGAAVSYTNWEGGYPVESLGNQCICIGENRLPSFGRKWRACNCNHSYAVVCQKEINSTVLTTQVVATEDFQSAAYFPIHNTTDSYSSSHSPLSPSPSPSTTTPKTKPTAAKTTTTKATSTKTKTPKTTKTTTPKTTKTTTPKTTKTTTPKTTETKTTTAAKTSTKRESTNETSPKSNDSTSRATSTIKTTPATSTLSTAVYIRPTTPITNPPAGTKDDGSTFPTLPVTQILGSHFPKNQTTVFDESAGLSNPLRTDGIILIILLFVTVVFIVAAVIVVIRKRRYDRRNEESSTKNTNQDATVSSAQVYASVVPVNNPPEGPTASPGNTIYSDVEMTHRPTPSDNTIYASVKPAGDVIDLGKSVDYADLDFPLKSQQKPRSADKITAWLSPIYAQPFEPSTSANSTEYAEPFKPGKTHTAAAAAAPLANHPYAAGDQQNIYSFAKEIPSDVLNVIYSEPVKTGRSSAPMGKEASMADKDIYQEAIDVKRGAGIGGDATQDPSVVYSEPIRQKSYNKS